MQLNRLNAFEYFALLNLDGGDLAPLKSYVQSVLDNPHRA